VVSFSVAGVKPWRRAAIVAVPASKVDRTLARLMPASVSKYCWLILCSVPLL
jgi:hypothetical protein